MSQTNVIEFRPNQEPEQPEGWTLEQYKRAFRDAEEAHQEPRSLAYRDRDYCDNYDDDQWTQYEKRKLKERRQQVVTSNLIKRKVNSLLGQVERMKSDPKAYPAKPGMEEAADIVTDVLDYIERNTEFDNTEWECAFDLAWAGAEIVEVTIDPVTTDVVVEKIEYDRFFYDPRSLKKDFSDARYLGYCEWMDIDEAKAKYPGKEGILSQSFDGLQSYDDGYEDKPWGNYASKDKERVRIVVCYYKRADGVWMLGHFTGAGVLYEDVSPWPDERGNAPGLIAQALYRNREGRIFGQIRDWISNQNEVNQRKSRSLHLLSDRRTWGVEGWTDDENQAKEALARPDGHLKVTSPINSTWGMIENVSEVQGNLELLQAAIADIELGGQYTNADQGRVSDQSGRAILALQQAGITQDAPFFKAHNNFKLRVYRRMWFMAKAFWREQRAIPMISEHGDARFLQVNIPVKDQWGQIIGLQNPIGEIDADIIIETGPDMITLQSEQFEQLTQIIPALAQLPAHLAMMLIEASSLRNKKQIIEAMQQFYQSQGPDPMEAAKTEADVGLKKAQTIKTLVDAEKSSAEIGKVGADANLSHMNAAKAYAEAKAGPEKKEPAKK